MSKRKSLARLAVERSQLSQAFPGDNIRKSSSNARPLGHHVESDQTTAGAVKPRPSPPSTSNGVSLPPAVTRRRPGWSGAETSIGPDQPAVPARTNRHSYPAAAAAGHGQPPRLGWESPPAGSRPPPPPAASPQQRPHGASPQRLPPGASPQWLPPGASPQRQPRDASPSASRPGRVLLPDGSLRRCGAAGSTSTDGAPPSPPCASPPEVSLSPPGDAWSAPAHNGGLCASPTVSSDSSGGGGGGPALLTTRHMAHAHSTNDLQGTPGGRAAQDSPGSHWNAPMAAGHRTRSFPAGLAGSVETLSSCSEPSAGSPLSAITVQKARSRGYLVNQTGSALLLGADELNTCLPQRQLHVLVGTWNMNAKEPPSCLDDLVLPDSLSFVPDLVVLGTQESHADHRGLLVRLQSTLGPSHVLFHSASLGTLHVCVFIRRDLIWYCSVPEEANYSIRQPTAIKTKGCVAVGFQFFGTTFLFLTCHLTAHLEKQNQRIDDVRRICGALDLPQAIPSRSDSRDVTERYDNVFWFGDLNFRLSQSRPRVIDTIVENSTSILLRERTMSEACMRSLLEWDQLNHAKHKGRAFEGFCEGDISFLPTYKYDPGTNNFDTSSKQRIPAYTDRILFKSRRDGIRCVKYDSVHPFNTSDHKPVWGLYQCQIRPSMDSIPLAAGQFNRAVFLEGLRRRARHLPATRGTPGRPCSVQ